MRVYRLYGPENLAFRACKNFCRGDWENILKYVNCSR